MISPLYGNVCRYYPSCSAYALRAVQVHGSVKGSWLAARRLVRCHPWAAGGYDPVPGTPEFAEEQALLQQGRMDDHGHPAVAGTARRGVNTMKVHERSEFQPHRRGA